MSKWRTCFPSLSRCCCNGCRFVFLLSFLGAFWFYRDLSKNKNKCDSETRPPNWWAQPNGLRTHLCFLSLLSPNGTPILIIYVHAFAGIQTIWNCFPSSPRSLSTTSRWIVRWSALLSSTPWVPQSHSTIHWDRPFHIFPSFRRRSRAFLVVCACVRSRSHFYVLLRKPWRVLERDAAKTKQNWGEA